MNCSYLNIYIRPLSSVENKCGSFCMNRTTKNVTETWKDNLIYTCDLPTGCEWRYQKLQVIVIFVVFRSCMCTCLSVAHQSKKQARRKTHIWPTIRKSIIQIVKLSKILINLISQVQYPSLWWCWQSYSHRISNNPPLSKE